MIGQTVSHYRIGEKLGGGGMGVVYKAGGAVRIDLARGNLPGSLGEFGWTGAATTFASLDPKEKLVTLVFAQHFPHNEHGLFWRFSTLVYSAITD